jgi:hypothetical protein
VFVQGTQDVIHKDEIPHDPGIVERRRESEFVSIERTEFVPGDKKPVLLGMDRALSGDRVHTIGVR